MLQFFSSDFAESFQCVRNAARHIERLPGSQNNPKDAAVFLLHCLAHMRLSLGRFELSQGTHDRYEQLRVKIELDGVADEINRSIVLAELEGFEVAILKELRGHLFLAIPQANKDLFEQKEPLFGAEVHARFMSARADIASAGKCLALDEYTASVFHLMRAAEIGLRVLAWDRRVVLRKRPRGVVQPLNLATWDKILDGLEKAETEIEDFQKTTAREAQLAFYHGAMIELRAFKNLFRNRTMHTRESYDEPTARGAFNHVERFMRTIAERVSETERTPLRWTNKWLGL